MANNESTASGSRNTAVKAVSVFVPVVPVEASLCGNETILLN